MKPHPHDPTYKETCDALKDGRFAQWPKKIQEKALLKPDKGGWTPLHYVAMAEQAALKISLGELPQEFLTEKNLLRANSAGQTPLHVAAYCGHLSQIPRPLLSEKNLLTPNSDHLTPLHYAFRHGHLSQIPFPISAKTLQALLSHPKTPEPYKLWIKKELQKKELQTGVQNSLHPDL